MYFRYLTGTGWSTKIHNHDVRDVIANIKRLLNAQEPLPMMPAYKNFQVPRHSLFLFHPPPFIGVFLVILFEEKVQLLLWLVLFRQFYAIGPLFCSFVQLLSQVVNPDFSFKV